MGVLGKEIFAIGSMVDSGCFGSERRREPLRVCDGECAINLVGRDMVEAFTVVFLG